MKYVLTDTVITYRMRYAIAVPDDVPDDDAKERANDAVANEDVEEFSQHYVGEQIASNRVIDEEEYIRQYDEDNGYLANIPLQSKLKLALLLDE